MIEQFIEYLKNNNISKEDTIGLLKNDNSLTREEKNLIYSYCFPRQLLDRELPLRIKSYREKSGYSGLELDLSEVALIIEAGQTEQYKRFIKHLMHSFCDPSKIHPTNIIGSSENPRCGICDTELLSYNNWESYTQTNNQQEKDKKECLAFGSTESGIVLCKHCLLQLVKATEVINELDPGYLDWTKRKL